MIAVLSCIHGNLEALDAVLADIADHPVTGIYCLGVIVGYGPNPIECLELAQAWDVVLLGNHDLATLIDPDAFCVSSEKVIFWTQSVLEHGLRNDLWDYLGERPRQHKEGDVLFVHGSARSPTNEYVFPEDIYNDKKMSQIAQMMPRLCFAGHTHIPGTFVHKEGGQWSYHDTVEIHHRWKLDERKTLINVGSVGQPRDSDWRAGYVLFDGSEVIFRRVEYDVDATIRKIYDIPELENFLGDRLREGR